MNSICQKISKSSRRPSTGFSLVELLLVVGFIAAGTVLALIGGRRYMDNVKVDDAAQAIAMITKSAHNMESVALSYAILDTNLAAVMPADLMEVGGGALRNSPWGTVAVASIDVGSNPSSAFKITYSTVPQYACAKFIVKNYAEFAQVVVNGTSAWSKADGAPDPAVITTACAHESNTIEFESLSLQGLTPVAPSTTVPTPTTAAAPTAGSTPASSTPTPFTPTGSGSAPSTAPTPAAPPAPATGTPFVPTPATTHNVIFDTTPAYSPASDVTVRPLCTVSYYPSSMVYSCSSGVLTGSGASSYCANRDIVPATLTLSGYTCPASYTLSGTICYYDYSTASTATESCLLGGSLSGRGTCKQDTCSPVAPPVIPAPGTLPVIPTPAPYGCQAVSATRLAGPPLGPAAYFTGPKVFGTTAPLADGQTGIWGEVLASMEIGRRGAPIDDTVAGLPSCSNGTLTITWQPSIYPTMTLGGTESIYVPF